MKRILMFAAVLTVFFSHAGHAQGKDKWIVVARTNDIDQAVGVSSLYAAQLTRVVELTSGEFATVVGPVQGENIDAILKADPSIGDVPRDAKVVSGEDFAKTVWDASKHSALAFSRYDTKTPAQFSSGSLRFTVTMQGDEDAPGATVVSATDGQSSVFNFSTPTDYSIFSSDAALIKLDPETDAPQLVFTRYTGGAHCCTQTWIATHPKGASGWSLVDGGMLDGSGYVFEDFDGDGTLELRGIDNSFLYAFDSYAGSLAPIRLFQLRGGVLVDVSSASAFLRLLKQDVARMEFIARLDPGAWKTNGFLVGWLAAKMRLGHGDDAWRVVEENIDSKSEFGPSICTTGESLENCAPENLQQVPVLQAIAEFMRERDYGPLPEAAQRFLKN